MRTYDVVDDATGAVLRTETLEDHFRPALLQGHTAVLVAIDGEKLAKRDRVEVEAVPASEPAADPEPIPEKPARKGK